jgi:hypothetical protein
MLKISKRSEETHHQRRCMNDKLAHEEGLSNICHQGNGN